MKTKKMIIISMFICMSLAIYALESMIPPLIPFPGVKLGLANIITLVSIYIIGKKEAFAIILGRVFLSALIFGQAMSLWFSLSGAMMSFFVMALFSHFMDESNIWAISVFGAFFHNMGQLAVAMIITGQSALLYYFLIMVISSVVTGVFVGICAKLCINKARKINILHIK